jgi:hypothetical protein
LLLPLPHLELLSVRELKLSAYLPVALLMLELQM